MSPPTPPALFQVGNATILRGGREALHSNQIIASTMVDAAKLPPHFPEAPSRSSPRRIVRPSPLCSPSPSTWISACRAAAKASSAPSPNAPKSPSSSTIKGVCHVYVDAEADPRYGRSHRPECQSPAPGRLQCHGNPPRRPPPSPLSSSPHRPASRRTSTSNCASTPNPGAPRIRPAIHRTHAPETPPRHRPGLSHGV
jgi:hypothetical protein